jgi:hypothetical protein
VSVLSCLKCASALIGTAVSFLEVHLQVQPVALPVTAALMYFVFLVAQHTLLWKLSSPLVCMSLCGPSTGLWLLQEWFFLKMRSPIIHKERGEKITPALPNEQEEGGLCAFRKDRYNLWLLLQFAAGMKGLLRLKVLDHRGLSVTSTVQMPQKPGLLNSEPDFVLVIQTGPKSRS